ncbi:MAG: OmpA family protein [Pseudomonadota bacterium]
MNRTRVAMCGCLFAAATAAALIYRPVVAADPATPVAQDQVPADTRADFDALISEIEARQPPASAEAGETSDDATSDQLRAANIKIGVVEQAVVAALAARAEAEAQLEALWRNSREEIEALKVARAEDAARITELERALADAKAAAAVTAAKGAEESAVQSAAFTPEDEAAPNGTVASGQAQDPLAKVEPATGPTEIQLGEIHFNPGSADLTPGAKQKALDAAEQIKGLDVSRVRIAGYSDTKGPAAFNKHLSLERARSIADLLESVGVAAEIIELEGNGEDGAPIPTGDQVSEPLNRCAGIFALAELPLTRAAAE